MAANSAACFPAPPGHRVVADRPSDACWFLQSRRDRVAAKFVEAEFEKCDRLMEIYDRYEGRVAAEEAR